MDLDTTWTDASGYRPIRVKLTPISPLPVAREITFRLKIAGWFPGSPTIRQWQTIVVPAGSAPVEAQISCPLYSETLNVQVEVWEGSNPLKALWPTGAFTNPMRGMQEALPRVLAISNAGTPDSSQLCQALPQALAMRQYYQSTPLPTGTVNPPFMLPTLQAVGTHGLPLRWLDYTSADIVTISFQDLTVLPTSAPPQLDALRRWLLAGGNLIVGDLGQDFAQAADLSTLLTLPPAAEISSSPPVPDSWSRVPDWHWPRPDTFGQVVDSLGVTYDDAEAAAAPLNTRTEIPTHPGFVWRDAGLGRVVAVSGPVFPGTHEQWQWILNTLDADRWDWTRRNGLSMMQSNDEFWNFLIPGVGLAPVAAFQWLITLFVIAIGPLNYWLLRRRGRLQWIVLTAPLLALVVTLSLFGYAFASDGLATRFRARSYTEIDQRNQQVACWSRLSYYAGIAPSEGLRFSDDIAVFPIDPTGFAQPSFGPRERWFDWQEEGQYFRSGWLLSRTPMQLLTIRQRPSSAGITLTDREGQLHLTNRLGSTIQGGAVHMADGRLFWCDSVVHDGHVALTPIDGEQARAQLRSIGRGVILEPASAVDANSRGFWFGRRAIFYPQSQASTPHLSQGLLERQIRASLTLAPFDGSFPPRSYVFLTDGSREIETGVDSAQEEASFHVCAGRW